jgi:hypothetical protein
MTRPSFTDRAGRTWFLELNYGLARQIHKDHQVDFANAHNGEALRKLASDDELLVTVLFALVEQQAEACGVTPEQFAEGLDGATFEQAGEAIGQMIALFTRPTIRPVVEEMLAQGRAGRQAAVELATAKLRGPEAQAAIARELDKLDQRMTAALTQ